MMSCAVARPRVQPDEVFSLVGYTYHITLTLFCFSQKAKYGPEPQWHVL